MLPIVAIKKVVKFELTCRREITKIQQDGRIYIVTSEPNFVERLFGFKTKINKYKDTGSVYNFGGGHEYVNEKGESMGNTMSPIREALDNWRRKF